MPIRPKITGASGNLERDFAVIKRNLNVQIAAIKDRTNKGLILAAVQVRRAMKTPPKIPVEYANLKASWFITTSMSAEQSTRALEITTAKFTENPREKVMAKLRSEHPQVVAESRGEIDMAMANIDPTSKRKIGVMMGFSAFYAAPVHEMGVSGKTAGKKINWSLSGSGAKFFQSALYSTTNDMLATIRKYAIVRP